MYVSMCSYIEWIYDIKKTVELAEFIVATSRRALRPKIPA